MGGFDARALAERARQLERFNEWERLQRRTASADPAGHVNAAGAVDAGAVQRMLAWYGDALDFATRHGSPGPGAREPHLEHLVEWMRRWRAAWRLG